MVIVPVALLLVLTGLFLPAREVSIEPYGRLSLESKITISIGYETAYASPDTESLYPTGQVTWTNLDGDYTDVDDDPDSPDANWADALADGTDTVAHVSFTSPSGNLNTGADLQEFKIYVRRSAAGGNNPDVQISLYESGNAGNPLAQTASLEVTSDTGELFTLTWDASLLIDISGVDVECRIDGKRSGGSPANKRTVEVGAVEWNVDYSAAEDISNIPTSKAFGLVNTSTDYWSTVTNPPTWPLDDTECHFTVTNNSSAAVKIDIRATDFSGGTPGWTLAGTPSADTVVLKAGKSGDSLETNMVTLTTSDQAFITSLDASLSKMWELKMETPTSFSNGDPKSSTITLTATSV